jgi:Ser/Thr protein kinase RdoA (MazF antagonist)
MSKFPVTESTLSSHHLGQFFKEKYSLGPETQCRLFKTGMNHSYLVNEGANKFIFRVYTLGWRSKTAISEELRLLSHLKENHISVAYPLSDSHGDYIMQFEAPEGLRYGVLFSYAEGEKISKFSAMASYNVGVAMARMHELTEGFFLDRVTYDSQVLLINSSKQTRDFFTKQTEETLFVQQLSDYLVGEYEKINWNSVRKGSVHLDIWFDNLHISRQEKITIFDFDFCGNGWLCIDIAYFLFQLYNTNQGENECEPKERSFMEGYESVIKLTEEEKRIIPITGLGIFLFYLGKQCQTYDTWSNVFLNDDHLKRFLGQLKRWIAYNKVPFNIS